MKSYGFANSKKIKELKIKRLKFRDNLRYLRRKNNLLLTLGDGTEKDRQDVVSYRPFIRFREESLLNLSVQSGNTYFLISIPKFTYSNHWLINLTNSIAIISELISIKTLTYYSNNTYKSLYYIINTNLLNYFSCYSYIRYKLPIISHKSSFLLSKVDKILILNNKRSQFYITHLSSLDSAWKTDISVYPGVLAALFNQSSKYSRNKFKKKDKNILRALNRCFYWVLPSYLNESRKTSRMVILIKKYPRSLEFYDTFISFITKVYSIKVPLILINPSIRHSFIKLRKYARVKRRSRKVITKSSSSLKAGNLVRSNQIKSISLTYAFNKARS